MGIVFFVHTGHVIVEWGWSVGWVLDRYVGWVLGIR